jgi:hypothetical protein
MNFDPWRLLEDYINNCSLRINFLNTVLLFTILSSLLDTSTTMEDWNFLLRPRMAARRGDHRLPAVTAHTCSNQQLVTRNRNNSSWRGAGSSLVQVSLSDLMSKKCWLSHLKATVCANVGRIKVLISKWNISNAQKYWKNRLTFYSEWHLWGNEWTRYFTVLETLKKAEIYKGLLYTGTCLKTHPPPPPAPKLYFPPCN